MQCVYANGIQSSEDFYGILIGDASEEHCNIVGCIRCTYDKNTTEKHEVSNKPDWVKEVAEICTLIPTGKLLYCCCVAEMKCRLDDYCTRRIF